MKQIDALGKACPIPVIEMKKALADNDQVEIKVDNEISTQNLKKLADEYAYDYAVEKLGHKEYQVTFTATADSKKPGESEATTEEIVNESEYIVVVDDNKLGGGDETLGQNLLKSFIYALTEQDVLPKQMLFYNGGVHLTSEENDVTEDLEKLQEAGVEILSCGLCVDYYNYDKANMAIGSITNMYEIVRILRTANRIVRP